jgi:hypothetical protein
MQNMFETTIIDFLNGINDRIVIKLQKRTLLQIGIYFGFFLNWSRRPLTALSGLTVSLSRPERPERPDRVPHMWNRKG